jgi:hypothetical protein
VIRGFPDSPTALPKFSNTGSIHVLFGNLLWALARNAKTPYVWNYAMAFPATLFDELAQCESNFQKASEAANIRRQRELDAVKQQMKELAEADDQIRRTTTEARFDSNRNQQQETKKLLADKQKYAAEKHELEEKVARLKEQINCSVAPKMSEASADASLAVFRSLAPIKLQTARKGRLRGVIAMGTPDTTAAFDYGEAHADETVEQFWRLLEGLTASPHTPSDVNLPVLYASIFSNANEPPR